MVKTQEESYNEDVFCPFIDATCRKKCIFFDTELEEFSSCLLVNSLHGFHFLLGRMIGSDEIIEEENLEEKKFQKLKLKKMDKL